MTKIPQSLFAQAPNERRYTYNDGWDGGWRAEYGQWDCGREARQGATFDDRNKPVLGQRRNWPERPAHPPWPVDDLLPKSHQTCAEASLQRSSEIPLGEKNKKLSI